MSLCQWLQCHRAGSHPAAQTFLFSQGQRLAGAALRREDSVPQGQIRFGIWQPRILPHSCSRASVRHPEVLLPKPQEDTALQRLGRQENTDPWAQGALGQHHCSWNIPVPVLCAGMSSWNILVPCSVLGLLLEHPSSHFLCWDELGLLLGSVPGPGRGQGCSQTFPGSSALAPISGPVPWRLLQLPQTPNPKPCIPSAPAGGFMNINSSQCLGVHRVAAPERLLEIDGMETGH